MKNLKNRKAFTIIEVVLVLAIAGLIMLAVFVAIPALQRSKRNQIRDQDMSRIMKAVRSYQDNHNGKIPAYIASGKGALDASFPNEYVDSNASHSATVAVGNNTKYSFACASGCSDFSDPDGTPYEVLAVADGDAVYSEFNHTIQMIVKTQCATSNDGSVTGTNNPNDLSIVYVRENGTRVCVDNQ